jgi:hypothetical protein
LSSIVTVYSFTFGMRFDSLRFRDPDNQRSGLYHGKLSMAFQGATVSTGRTAPP